mmetsp:Transcript_1397/g.2935  ORF Transcript_1397/g.2935 Transcript_1397/m.2935 type:complete len:120 (-) Transcript_1397:187-546(-)|eukprot:CAMPEP_0172298678 /NCGR_PEP_ID=MMETSP1058-20130122/1224_1 /TAXON_ID=83371 /ORGANISM="Detonula confervacea, Strain CCMP 353" /LENGTH=119 /DNA_ID=CAMNT_0013007965 /DNA_START=300 /DNA_END=659 /DNA_ORIENTATION=+
MTLYEGESSDVWEDGMEEVEQIVLSDYKTKEEMHALMVEKGFQLKSPDEIEAMKLKKQKEAAEEEEKKTKRREENRIRREESRRKKEEEKKIKEEEKEKEDAVVGEQTKEAHAMKKEEL